MTENAVHLLTGVSRGYSNIGRLVAGLLLDSGESVRVMVHRDDGRADALRARGAEIVVGDLTRPRDVADAMRGVTRAFFNMAISADYLEAAAVVCSIAVERGDLEALVNLSQMTVSEMTSTSVEESAQQRLHWLAEHIMNWSGVPVVHVRPTVFLDNPIFTLMPRESIVERGELRLPFGRGRTSPVAATDVARVVAAILRDPARRVGQVYELTGPEALDVNGLAEQYSLALGRPVSGVDLPYEDFIEAVGAFGLPPHVAQHISTVAKLHRAGRYDRLTDDVETITGHPAESVQRYITEHGDLFGQAAVPAVRAANSSR